MPGFLFGLLAPVLLAAEGFGRPAIGVLVGLFFGATGLGSVAAGRLTERIGARAAVVADLLLLAVCLLVAAAVAEYAVLAAVAVVAGAGYALATTGTTSAVAAAVPAAQRTRVMAVRTAGIPALVAVASLGAGPLAAAWGWRPLLAVLAVPVLMVAAAAGRVLPDARPSATTTGRSRLPAGFGRLPVAAFLLIVGSQPVMVWSVAYLRDALALEVLTAGILAAAVSVVGVVGVLVMATRARAVGPGALGARAAVACGVAALGSVVQAVAVGSPGGPLLGITGLALATVAHLLAVGLLHALVVAVAPAAAGRAAGVAMTGYFLGALVSAPAFGAVVDATGWPIAWLLCATLVALAGACFLRCGRLSSPDRPSTGDGADAAPTARPAPRRGDDRHGPR
ncbi:MFS transporter [Pseudonocardia xishanensis]|uniref:Major facilitator superfamily (MFS) profile domain-containing protein n=1 Tax=Pseudonocardia xishanensis TaxID=630995 RepID=A0ABP8RM18_9PSEU